MINLLPQKNKKQTQKAFMRRSIVVFGLAIIILIFTQIILSFSLFFIVDSYIKNSASQIIITKEMAQKEGLEESESKIKNINELLLSFQINENQMTPITDDLFEIIDANKDNSVKLESFLFNIPTNIKIKPTVSIKGNTDTRENLVSFINILKSKNYFQDVQSPISNLLKEEDIDFSITIELKRQ